MDHRYNPQELIAFIKDLFHSAGMELEKCEVVAPLLIEADLIGHTTHGIAQVPAYLSGLQNGQMLGKGQPKVVSDRGPVIVWDGKRIPRSTAGCISASLPSPCEDCFQTSV